MRKPLSHTALLTVASSGYTSPGRCRSTIAGASSGGHNSNTHGYGGGTSSGNKSGSGGKGKGKGKGK
jgi:hypothetical protein